MFDLFLALHVLTAIFAIGPLVHAATTASRGLRTADASATATAARTVTIYTYVSVAVVVLGFGLMSMTPEYLADQGVDEPFASFSETWIWLSVVLWLAAAALALAVTAPGLTQATEKIKAGETVEHLTAKVAASGGTIGLVFAVITFLMVYKPGH